MDSIACPYCALLCDDIEAQPGQTPSEWPHLCDKGQQGFSQAARARQTPAQARIQSAPATESAAIEAATQILIDARQPLISGLGTDVQGMRAAVDLAQRTGAIISHASSAMRMRNLIPMQEHGAFLTTLSEIRNRADLLVMIGDQPLKTVPRFAERLLARDGLFVGRAERQSILIGAGTEKQTDLPVAHQINPDDLLDFVGLLLERSQAKVARDQESVPDLASADAILATIAQARYPVFVWDASQFDPDVADMLVIRLMRLVRQLNTNGRCSALPISGHDGESTAETVHLWRTSFALPARHGAGGVSYDPYQYQSDSVIGNKRIDALVWISTFWPDKTPPAFDGPTIVIGHGAMQCDTDVFIPVATPAAHCAGEMVRIDKVVCIPLTPAWDNRPSACETILKQIADQLTAQD